MPRHADKHRMSVTHRAGAPVRRAASLGVWLFVLGGFSGPLATTPLGSSSHGHYDTRPDGSGPAAGETRRGVANEQVTQFDRVVRAAQIQKSARSR
jgi:hypothetical protein